jgi:hypothetical protein
MNLRLGLGGEKPQSDLSEETPQLDDDTLT